MTPELLMAIGFLFAASSVLWNDSLQVLGPLITSTRGIVTWQKLWFGASLVLVIVVSYGWWAYGGDISYARLERIPFQEVTLYHALAPLLLLGLSWFGIPVSTSFLVLAAFSSSIVLQEMFWKSFGGLTVAAGAGFCIWWLIASCIKQAQFSFTFGTRGEKIALVALATSTAFLWAMWLMQDVSNIAVFLPREMPGWMLVLVLAVMIAVLGVVFRFRGGALQNIVRSKTNMRFVTSATVVNIVYGCILYVLKEHSTIPISTTWVFVGLLLGREAAIRSVMQSKKTRRLAPMIAADLSKLVCGAVISVALVLFIHNQWEWVIQLYSEHPFFMWPFSVIVVGTGVVANYVHHVLDRPKTEKTPRTREPFL